MTEGCKPPALPPTPQGLTKPWAEVQRALANAAAAKKTRIAIAKWMIAKLQQQIFVWTQPKKKRPKLVPRPKGRHAVYQFVRLGDLERGVALDRSQPDDE